MKLKPIAFYLPQFHPIPENDEWWGKGFTEWTNVRKAKPLFNNHYQPHIPSDLGYYDLRDEEVRIRQAELAKEFGVFGFCYWHYWFGGGRRLLEKPADDFLRSGKPDFPICFAWANQTWSGIWHGAPDRILIRQEYLGKEDDQAHFEEVLPYFLDSRYIRIKEKPLFLIYRPFDHPYLEDFISHWNSLAIKAGLKGVYFLGISYHQKNPYQNLNGLVFHDTFLKKGNFSFFEKAIKKITREYPDEIFSKLRNGCVLSSYKKMVERTYNQPMPSDCYPTLHTGWDNTPRSGKRGIVHYDFSLKLFGEHIEKIIDCMNTNQDSMFFIKSWNEWAEGNYLEPDERFRRGKLEVFEAIINSREKKN
ncbi:glycoside hydrolase family 99-like domain-containing protein [Algoriphagus sediminis]|uniref:Glycoside hydrolase family 99-like domain-containing protein n=1 Tax=Algoriphagus sediminis TaxID=3057113 RepID=A0ABT7YDT7_9BACT|nr:glycoside hydrolase family 99-like domain-containing protein [Algoriphagus sediminis]MDN3204696.1 glycoside hydrolase family 99-like domain-containing protein [Algoriphagus sediminis]